MENRGFVLKLSFSSVFAIFPCQRLETADLQAYISIQRRITRSSIISGGIQSLRKGNSETILSELAVALPFPDNTTQAASVNTSSASRPRTPLSHESTQNNAPNQGTDHAFLEEEEDSPWSLWKQGSLHRSPQKTYK